MEAIVLAGGKGTRLQSKVSDLPKPMAPVRGRPFLEHVLDYWIDQGVESFVLSIGHLAGKISEHFKDSYRGAVISYSRETEPLGTGGAILQALAFLGGNGPALVFNGDTFCGVPLDEFLRFHSLKESLFTLALNEVKENSRYSGVSTDRDGRCISMSPPPSGGNWINAGVYCVDPSFVGSWKNKTGKRMISLERDMLPDWMSRGEPVYGWKPAGPQTRFIDIGTPEDYEKAEGFFYG